MNKPPATDDDLTRLAGALRRIVQGLDSHSKLLETRVGLTASQLLCLQVLAQLQWPELTWSVTPGAFGPDKPGMNLVMSGLSANIQQTGTNPDHWLMVPGNYSLRLND